MKEKNEEISLLKQLETSQESIAIHEKCLEDADKRAAEMEKQNRELISDNEELKKKVEKVENEKKELKARLESGAMHYKKLAAEKNALMREMKTDGKSDEVYLSKIDSLESKVQQLSLQLDEARRSQELHLSQLSKAVSSTREGEMSLGAESLESVSTNSNTAMDSVQINQALLTSQTPPPQEPRVPMPSAFQPSLFQPFPPGSGSGVLPSPLQPENVGPSTLSSTLSSISSVPELTPRAPAPYSFSQPSFVSHCPLCQMEFTTESLLQIQEHVNRHIDESYHECPVCNMKFDMEVPQSQFEDHVQEHFRDQVTIY